MLKRKKNWRLDVSDTTFKITQYVDHMDIPLQGQQKTQTDASLMNRVCKILYLDMILEFIL